MSLGSYERPTDLHSASSLRNHASCDRMRISSVRSVKSLGGLLLEDEEPDQATGSHVGVSLFTTIVGTGILAMPRAVEEAGVVGFILGVFGVCGFTMFGSYLTYRTLEVLKHQDVEDVAQVGYAVLGKCGFSAALFVCLFDTWGATVGNLRAVADVASIPLEGIASPRTVILVTAALVFPLTLREKFSEFRWVSALAMAAMVCFVVVVAHQGEPSDLATALSRGDHIVNRAPSLLSAMAVLFFSFDFQVNLFPLYREINSGERSKVSALMPPTVCAMLCAVAVYSLVGLAGFSTYGDGVAGNILHDVKGKWWLKASFATAIFFAIPILVHECLHLALYYLFPERTSKAIPAMVMVGSAAYCAAELPVYTTFKYVGGTVGVAFSSILPPAFFLFSVRTRLRSGAALHLIPRAESEPLLMSPQHSAAQHTPQKAPATPLVEPQMSHAFYSQWEIWAASLFLAVGLAAVPVLLVYME